MASIRYRFVGVYFIPGAEGVTLAVRPLEGPLAKTSSMDLFTTQRVLAARSGDAAADERPLADLVWGDAACRAEAVAQLSVDGWDAEVMTWDEAEAYLAAQATPPAPPSEPTP